MYTQNKEILYILEITTKTKIRDVQLPIMWDGEKENTIKHYGNRSSQCELD